MRNTSFFLFITLFLNLTAVAQQPDPTAPDHWDASWIGPCNTSLKRYGVFLFRKEFTLSDKPQSFIVHLSADNRYQLFVNGKSVILGPQRADPAHWRYETIDLAPFLQNGKNVLAAWVWNQGEQAAWAQLSQQTGLLIQGHSKTEAVVNTNHSWRVIENMAYTPLANVNHIVGPFDQVFAQRYPWGWEQPTFADEQWLPACETERPVPFDSAEKASRKLTPRNIPLLEERQQRFARIRRADGIKVNMAFLEGNEAINIPTWSTVTLLIDQDSLTTAYPELLVSGGRGAKITATYAEALFDTKSGQKGNRNDVTNKRIRGDYDVFLLDGEAKRLYRPLWYRTFRYVELTIENHQNPLTIHDYSSRFTAYPFVEKASFFSSDSSLASMWRVGWRTARLCANETYMDCPYYEQLQYIGDTRIQALISLYVSGDDRLMRNAIQQFADSQIPEGLTSSRYPSNVHQVIPPFSLFWITMIHDYWMHRRDDAFVKSYLNQIQEVVQFYEKYVNKQGMLDKMPYWNFVDWPNEWPWKGQEELSGIPAGALDGNSAILTLQYVLALRQAAALLTAYGEKTEAIRYAQLANKLSQDTYQLCWDSSRQQLADTPAKTEYSQHANVLAVLADAIPKVQQAALLQRIVADKTIIQCTIYYRFYLNQAFLKAGLGSQYIGMLTPWKQMLSLGLTTFAERPEPTRSDCHAWSASPVYDFLATVCGIKPAAPGFRRVRVNPQLGSLTWVSGSVSHSLGLIEVKFSQKNGVLTADIKLPATLTGELVWNNKRVKLHDGSQHLVVK
ncbi:alpha-L-rhamnosidase [Spirosoma aureum]|uniref:Alpha-L-rhamnosidase n=1 Tax=Spirosoma aureum TaxID=2692134 RepID=A0A6G9AXY4_9BACT|nr:family 78 glycoside hydrolase catalytic domain [Spirosoma aureum]QIP17322.1 alpha-L-rhamnosidase [Spirosoma aureum]